VKSVVFNVKSLKEPPRKPIKCLFSHGYQFEPPELYESLAPAWAFSLKFPDFLKELVNLLWNGIIKGMDERDLEYEEINEETIRRMVKKKKKELNRTQKVSYYILRYWIIKNLVKIKKEEEHKAAIRDNGDFNREIVNTFLPDIPEAGITHVIYAHSHTKQEEIILNEISLYNAGGWQQVPEPAYIEILSNGDINVKSLSEQEISLTT
jgi:hypothetical protein